MRMLAFAAGRVRRRVVPAILLLTLVCAGNAAAQSFLGTVRGTVVDPQGAAVAGAAILIVDEATGVPRTLETDAQGRYEATNVKPGTYRVEVIPSVRSTYDTFLNVIEAADASAGSKIGRASCRERV